MLQTYILMIFIKEFQSPLRKLFKGDAMSPLVSNKSTKSFTPLFETLFYLTLA
jgi:hypothetical protein